MAVGPLAPRLAALLLLASLGLSRAESWRVQFFHDQDDSELAIHDLVFPSSRRGVAVGSLAEGRRIRPVALLTADGGDHWDVADLKEDALSLYFLNEQLGWMVTDEGLWRSQDSGQSWEKVKKVRGLRRVCFVDASRGWAVGHPKAVYATTDGGLEWSKLPEADQPKSNPEYTTYAWIEFANPRLGIIAGWSHPPRRGESRLPPWMEPERARRQRQWPSLTILLQTPDGGRSWKPSATSMFGRITRLSLNARGQGLALVEFQDTFEWPSEVYGIDLEKNSTTRIFRRKDCAVTDVTVLANGTSYLAGFEPQGTMHESPIPGKVKILRSQDLVSWEEMSVDYRATARRLVFACAGPDLLWVATDTGMILKRSSQ